jgi:pimeloyl-ACP methyl ester carboxylesterase
VTLEYTEQGDSKGVPVILLHGYTDSRRSWDLVLPHLPSRFRVFAVTQRGHGLSSRPVRGYGATDLAADLRAFLDAQKISRAVIVGHSMGSMVAQRFAIDNPDRVQGLILTGAFYARRNNPLLIEFWNQAISTLSEPVDPAFIAEFQRSTTADSLPTEFFTTALAESGRLPAWLWRDLFRGFLVTDYTADIGRIKAPTLLLWGDQDGFALQADQDSLKSRIAGTRLTTYPGIGHAANWEIPERFSADLVKFVDGLGDGRSGRDVP